MATDYAILSTDYDYFIVNLDKCWKWLLLSTICSMSDTTIRLCQHFNNSGRPCVTNQLKDLIGGDLKGCPSVEIDPGKLALSHPSIPKKI